MDANSLRGVNLGGWLLLEKWMTPSVFAGTTANDEYTFMQTVGAKEKIDNHRKSFITESDFAWMQANGVNALRIPVGYWILKDDPPFISGRRYLDWAMNMAQKYSLQVIIDLHGLKGSQNGRDHSGKVGKSEWFKRTAYQQESLTTLDRVAKRYKDYDNFWGLQIINEPKLGVLHLTLRRYYHDAYQRLTRILRPHTRIIFSDAFTPRLLSGALRHGTHPVVMDMHIYHMATPLSQFFSVQWFLNKIDRYKYFIGKISKTQPVIVGEWSGVMRHETMRNIPQNEQAELFRQYCLLQIEAYDGTSGWFYWSYKTELPGAWNFRSQVETGLIRLNGDN
ncbi:cellulase family glycosylhydrolase [Candidatus Saccharibacteria bacterium]|nr:cellulase family glycosylhydrolase [Candidatus Saccharibacteria bacterium]